MPITLRRSALGNSAVVAVLLTTAVTGCSSDPGSGDSDPELMKGLSILADDNRTDQVTYLDVAEVRKLSKGDAKRFDAVGRPGTSLVNSYMPGPLGQHLKVTDIDTAVDSPKAGHWEGSFDAAAITNSLKSKGYTQREKGGNEVWTHPDSSGASFVSFQISEDEISYSSGAKLVSAVNPKKGASLAGNKDYQRAAECLGDVYRADFNPLTTAKPVRLSVLGQQAASAAKNTEVLCVMAKDEATANRLVTKLRSAVRAKAPDFDGTKVTLEKGDRPFVRAVVPDTATQRPGRLLVSDWDLWMAILDV